MPTCQFQAALISFPCAKLNWCEIQIEAAKNEYDAQTRSRTLTPDTQQLLCTDLLHMHVHVHEDLTLQDVCPWNYECLCVFGSAISA